MSTTISAENLIDRDHHQDAVRRGDPPRLAPESKAAPTPTGIARAATGAVMNRRWRNAVTSAVPLLALCALLVGSSSAGAATLLEALRQRELQRSEQVVPLGIPGAGDFVRFEVGAGSPYTVTFPGNLTLRSNCQLHDQPFAGPRQRGHILRLDPALRGPSTYTVGQHHDVRSEPRNHHRLLSGETPCSTSATPPVAAERSFPASRGVAATIGDGAGSTGTLNVNVGAFNVTGSDFTQTQLIVGNHGTGTLNVNNGARCERHRLQQHGYRSDIIPRASAS